MHRFLTTRDLEQLREVARPSPRKGIEARQEGGEEAYTKMPPVKPLEEEERRRDRYRL